MFLCENKSSKTSRDFVQMFRFSVINWVKINNAPHLARDSIQAIGQSHCKIMIIEHVRAASTHLALHMTQRSIAD